MTTVGYGDGYPSTHLGRFVASLACLLGMFLISLIIIALINLTDFTQQERKAYDIIKILNNRKNIK